MKPTFSPGRHFWGGSGISPLEAQAGIRVLLGEDIGIQVLHPPPRPLGGTSADSNNNSVVLRLEYGNVSFLLNGDIEAFAESYLVRQGAPLSSNVMTAPHHGSRSSSTPEFIAAVDPQLILISAGLDNQYGHPHPETTRHSISACFDRTYSGYVGGRGYSDRDRWHAPMAHDGEIGTQSSLI